jgi:rRNA maturation endonuclease Nob1
VQIVIHADGSAEEIPDGILPMLRVGDRLITSSVSQYKLRCSKCGLRAVERKVCAPCGGKTIQVCANCGQTKTVV